VSGTALAAIGCGGILTRFWRKILSLTPCAVNQNPAELLCRNLHPAGVLSGEKLKKRGPKPPPLQ
jgi:hypothetical protein